MEIAQRLLSYKIGSVINIFFLGDIHEGSGNFADKPFKRAINYIENTDNSYIIGMGDYIDAISYRDKRFNPSEIAPEYAIRDLKDLPVIQIERLCKKLLPVQERFIAFLYGNHEEAFSKYNSFDPVKRMAQYLGSDAPR